MTMQQNIHHYNFYLCLLICNVAAPPAPLKTTEKADELPDWDPDGTHFEVTKLEYGRYLREVIDLLESDPAYKEKMKNANETQLSTGELAEELDFVHHNVRTRLDELKRIEVQRLRELIHKQIEADKGDHNVKMPTHLDAENAHSGFGKEDFKKLIEQARKDLDEIDQKRREEFKEYEMDKEIQWRDKIAHLNETERKHEIEEHEKMQAKHRNHEKINHPGGKEQLQEVWEDVDKLPKESFDMRTLFNLHDLNGDGYLDPEEVETLFQAELDKIYDKNATEDDLVEREEEEARMREHVEKEMDADKDGLISLAEFLNEEKDPNFDKKDEGWDAIGETKEPEFKEDELKAHEEKLKKQQEEKLQLTQHHQTQRELLELEHKEMQEKQAILLQQKQQFQKQQLEFQQQLQEQRLQQLHQVQQEQAMLQLAGFNMGQLPAIPGYQSGMMPGPNLTGSALPGLQYPYGGSGMADMQQKMLQQQQIMQQMLAQQQKLLQQQQLQQPNVGASVPENKTSSGSVPAAHVPAPIPAAAQQAPQATIKQQIPPTVAPATQAAPPQSQQMPKP